MEDQATLAGVLRALQSGEIHPLEAKAILVRARKTSDGAETNSAALRNGATVAKSKAAAHEPIAIVGLSGRYPGARDMDEFWKNLAKGHDAISEIPASRWDVGAYYRAGGGPDRINCKWMGALAGVEEFDPLFFNISPSQAAAMDPQHRLFLQEAYHAFEDAAYSPQMLSNSRCGVYLGIMGNEYATLVRQSGVGDVDATGNSAAIAAGRLAYHLNLKGPAMSIDTACSSSLVATHLACQALRSGEVDIALAGAVTLYLSAESYLAMCGAGMLSPTGRCRPFDNSADGFIPGEGVGVLVLKRLRDAQADNDNIHGLIIGSGINQDGRTNGITAPSLSSQAELLHEVYCDNGIDPRTIGFAEMHGTGTKVGDPIELEAAMLAFRRWSDAKSCCAIGSVKGNIGHVSAAAGVAGAQKVLLQFRHETIVPTLHFEHPNEHFDFATSPFYVPTEPQPWPRQPAGKRRASVSSFGFSGTNAHVILEEYEPAPEGIEARGDLIFVLSARTEEQLRIAAGRLRDFMQSHSEISLRNLAHTLQVGRATLRWRLAFVASSHQEAISGLTSLAAGKVSRSLFFADTKQHREAVSALGGPPGGNDAAAAWLKKGELAEIAAWWAKGLEVDWALIGAGGRRVSLPAYPFAQQRCWFTPASPMIQHPGRKDEAVVALDPLRIDGSGPLVMQPIWQPVEEGIPVKPVTEGKTLIIAQPARMTHLQSLFPNAVVRNYSTDYLIDDWHDCLARTGQIDHLIVCPPATDGRQLGGPALNGPEIVLSCFRLIKALLSLGYGEAALGLTVVTSGADGISSHDTLDPAHAGIAGLFGSVAKELPRWRLSLVDFAPENPFPEVVPGHLPSSTNGEIRLYRDGRWYRQCLQPVQLPPTTRSPYRRNGLYVVIGGSGGIGEIWSAHMIRTYAARIIWIGRRPLDAEIQARLDALAALGGEAPVYIAADARDAEALERAARDIEARHGEIHGLVHAAIVLRDMGIASMAEHDFRDAFSPKAETCVALARAFRPPVDFLAIFSSLESFSKEAGQSNYAAGSAFQDAFAHQLARTWPCKVAVVNWGYWGAVGATKAIPAASKRGLARGGVAPIQPSNAFLFLEYLLASSRPRLAFLHTSRSDFAIASQNVTKDPKFAPAAQKTRASDAGQIVDLVKDSVMDAISHGLAIPVGEIDMQDAFADYGVDSITGIHIVSALNKALSITLTTTVLFDHSSVERLTRHILETYGAQISVHMGPAGDEEPPRQPFAEHREPVLDFKRQPIAIVGMGGRYPKSPDLDCLWRHLASGDNLVTDATRWNLSELGSSAEGICWKGGFIDDIDQFDPLFFGISATEALHMDPQQRLFLEEAWKVLETAGYVGRSVQGSRIGVYAGCSSVDYVKLLGAKPPAQAMWGNASSVLAARIAYCLDLQGPAVSVDTACSSSLVAIHLACQGLWSGEMDMALAGGVSLMCTPDFYLVAGRAGMLSPMGRCHTFDSRADGFVPAEGVGLVLLKRLADALADGDQIHGVIVGIGSGQDGASNGITAPSPASQERLATRIYQDFLIDPSDIEMVEAHGTGTILGDPIEYQAISRTFAKHTGRRNYCAIGSIKTNFGHAGPAAGVAGLLKLLLSLKHRQIPPSLHLETGNKNIDFDNSPFYVSTRLKSWAGREGRTRRGAVSSFGLSGTNAHAVVQEAPDRARSVPVRPAYLIALSARTPGQLRQVIKRFVTYCKSPDSAACGDISHTLLVGRKHFEHRLACVVTHCDEAVVLLQAWLTSGECGSGLLYGQAVADPLGFMTWLASDEIAALRSGSDPEAYRRSLWELARHHCDGRHIDFAAVFGPSGAVRVALPTYPFARKRFWLSGASAPAGGPIQAVASLRHSSTPFAADAPYTREHVVEGSQILPAVLYLEMACAAALRDKHADSSDYQKIAIRLKDIVWLSPYMLDEAALSLTVDLQAGTRGITCFKIFSPDGKGGEVTELGKPPAVSILHCKGEVCWEVTSVAPLDLEALRRNCTSRLSSARCYAAFEAAKLCYGPYYRSLVAVHIAPDYVLAELVASGGEEPDLYLHPAIFDGALQATIGLFNPDLEISGHGTAARLFAIGSLNVKRKCPAQCWAQIRWAADGSRRDPRLDLDICDADGNICVAVRGLTYRETKSSGSSIESKTAGQAGLLSSVPVWELSSKMPAISPGLDNGVWAVLGADDAFHEALVHRWPRARIYRWDWQDQESLATKLGSIGDLDHLLLVFPSGMGEADAGAAQKDGLFACFRLLKALIAAHRSTNPLCLTAITFRAMQVLTGEAIDATHASLHGFLGVVAKEFPAWTVGVLDMDLTDPAAAADFCARHIDAVKASFASRRGVLFEQRLRPYEFTAPSRSAFVHDGVYVLIGGAGAIGQVLSEYLIRVYQARIVWIGRRAPDGEIREKIERLGKIGIEPLYYKADAAVAEELDSVYKAILSRFGHVDGLVHSTLAMCGAELSHMDEDRFREGTRAKIDVALAIADVVRKTPPGLLLVFSSVQSFERTPRQANYAAGSVFIDSLAAELANDPRLVVKLVNWGYWGTVGFAAKARSFRNWLGENGIGSIEPVEAMDFLERFISSPQLQATLVKTEPQKSILTEQKNQSVWFPAACDTAAIEQVMDRQARAMDNDDLLYRLLFMQLEKLKLFAEGHVSLAAWKDAVGFPQYLEGWLDESLRELSARGHLQPVDNCFIPRTPSINSNAAWDEWRGICRSLETDPAFKHQIGFLADALAALPDILSSRCQATDILFPRSDMARAQGIYKNNALLDYVNESVADIVAARVDALARDSVRGIRLLEVGAGTGGTSGSIFRKLGPYRDVVSEYCYTDISQAFLLHAEREYRAAAPYMRGAQFDAEVSPQEQGFDLGAYDIVIAANSLHATRNIERSLGNCAAILKTGGVLVLNELATKSAFTHLTFALLKGWWLFEDKSVRMPGSPGLFPQGWQQVLKRKGFGAVSFPAPGIHRFGLQIVTAQKGADDRTFVAREAPVTTITPISRPGDGPVSPATKSEIEDETVKRRVRDFVLNALSSVLGLEVADISWQRPFAEYGVDSILAVQTADTLNDGLGIALTSTSLFDYSTVDALCARIVTGWSHQLAEKWPEPRGEKTPEPGLTEIPLVRPAAQPQTPVVAAPGPSDGGRIAIIGMSGRYAGASNVEELWEALAAGRDLIIETPRWKTSIRGGFLPEIDRFDAAFFNISGLEASFMDPQQRIFLEEVWKAVESAGYAGTIISGRKCGVYAGYNGSDYHDLISGSTPAHAMWGNAASVLSARIAYYMNLQGPALTIDTACSSALVAMHVACQALRAGEIDFAIAGGIALHCTPAFHQAATRAGMLSPDAICYAFDGRANGFVPGEGAGVLVLRRLADAMADGDNILAVIRGSAINQDGTTNGITAPSALSQERLERQTYETFGIRPDEIQMVEAHGTGTKLGDPIEYEALRNAFAGLPMAPGSCALGSIKTNIGHTTAASGAAGVIKAVLSLEHGKIPASLNFEKPNPHIDFSSGPFFVNTVLRDWQPPGKNRRCAAISSFGISGTNAHMVIEENTSPQRKSPHRQAYLFAWSAATSEQLHDQVKEFRAHLNRHPQLDIGNASFTLLTGRKHIEYRVTCVARDRATLLSHLDAWIETGTAPLTFVGTVKGERSVQTALRRLGDKCIQQCAKDLGSADYVSDLAAVADLFAQGYGLDFSGLFPAGEYGRIRLPTYPFADTRFWFDDGLKDTAGSTSAAPGTWAEDDGGNAHTLVVNGNERVFRDHIVHGRPILPGVAYLELMLASVERRELAVTGELAILRDVVWARPIDGTPGTRVSARFETEPDGENYCRIFSSTGTSTDFNAEARVVVTAPPAARPTLPLDRLRAQCPSAPMSGAVCYGKFAQMGLVYGPSHQCIQELYRGQTAEGPLVLAYLKVPAQIPDSDFPHAGLLDSALQASLGFMIGDEAGGAPGAPSAILYSLDSFELLGSCPLEGWTLVREAASSSEQMPRFDVDICDTRGEVFARMRGFTFRARKWAEKGVARADVKARGKMVTLLPQWGQVNLAAATPGMAVTCIGASNAQFDALVRAGMQPVNVDVTPSNDVASIAGKLVGLGKVFRLLWFAPPSDAQTVMGENVVTDQERGVLSCFRVVKALLDLGYEADDLHLTVVAQGLFGIGNKEKADPTHAGLAGLVGSIAKAYGHWTVALLDLESGAGDFCVEIPAAFSGATLSCRAGVWHKRFLQAVTAPQPRMPIMRREGVYVVLGGAGGIGASWSEHAIRQYGAQIVWIGRRQSDDTIKAEIARLAELGPEPLYLSADATDRAALQAACETVKARYGRVNGVINSVLLLADSSLANMDEAGFRRGVSSKVESSVRLAQVFSAEALDFILFFSSLQSFVTAAAQSNYAAGSAFQDAFAQRLAQDLPYPVKTVNWGYWGSVGRVATEHHNALMAKLGIGSIKPEEGFETLEEFLASPYQQMGAISVLDDRAWRELGLDVRDRDEKPVTSQAVAMQVAEVGASPARLREILIQHLKTVVGTILRIPPVKIDAHASLATYGIDSILAVHLAKGLRSSFRTVTSTLFFEYQNIADLATFLLESEADAVKALPGIAAVLPQPAQTLPIKALPTAGPRVAAKPRSRVQAHDEIAIVGLAGQYPQARDLRQFWELLRKGGSAIVEIPPSRWALDNFFVPDVDDAVRQGRSYSKWGGFIEGFAEFDPVFFGISPREAVRMDPQERLFLRTCWQAMEDAGYTREIFARRHGRRVGVFAGISETGFELYSRGLEQPEPIFTHTSFSSVSNRVSFLFNLQGPSIPIDTMCSSSLTAIHEACEHILRGECDLAFAGGVNLVLHPKTYVMRCGQRMLAPDGRCKTFSDCADGFVPGEGVGVVLLKRLSRAEADHDHIHGVIRGTSINHSGRTNGYSVPSPGAQRDLIYTALSRAGVDARQISYVEAHGTGTQLGDPIELDGLTQAFRKFTGDMGFCSIGSVKSNIGHLESAAGIAGITKVLLQMHHRELVPSLHVDKLNSHIDFEQSPFTVQRLASRWATAGDDTSPRLASVSSFGAGGANAHVVLEEYAGHAPSATPAGPVAILLSALSREQVQIMARDLADALATRDCNALRDIAYTLQTGRETFDCRLGLVATSIQDAHARLMAFADAGQAFGVGYAESGVCLSEELSPPASAIRSIDELQPLVNSWVNGVRVDWEALYQHPKPYRVPLPTYPFAREQYWITPQKTPIRDPDLVPPRAFRDLLRPQHRDGKQLFSLELHHTDDFVRDHCVGGRYLLAGTVYLEIIRAALDACHKGDARGCVITDIVWLKPFDIGEAGSVLFVELFSERDSFSVEIYSSTSASPEPAKVMHCMAHVATYSIDEVPGVDIGAVRTATAKSKIDLSRYAALQQEAGYGYGPTYQCITDLFGEQGGALGLARLASPNQAAASTRGNAGLMDAALQVAVAFLHGALDARKKIPQLAPFTADRVEIFSTLPQRGWAVIREAPAPGELKKADIDLCDDAGRLFVRLTGVSVRPWNSRADETDVRLLVPTWVPVSHSAPDKAASPHDLWIVSCGSAAISTGAIHAVHLVTLKSDNAHMAARYQDYAWALVELLGSIIKRGQPASLLLLCPPECSGLSAILKTASLEEPTLNLKAMLVRGDESAENVAKWANTILRAKQAVFRYEGDAVLAEDYEDVTGSADAVIPAFRSEGVYVITGGLGGLGEVFAREIAVRAPGARLLLVGRTPASSAISRKIEQLSREGALAEYHSVDISDFTATQRFFQDIQARFAGLDGIIHCAGVLRDRLIVNKTRQELDAVFAAKVAGTVNLDQASLPLRPALFVLFSSGAGVTGNVGQSDYAAANAFMDHYAERRNARMAATGRQERTLSISWPQWTAGEMSVSDQMREALAKAGIALLEKEHGIRAFYDAWETGRGHVVILPRLSGAGSQPGNAEPDIAAGPLPALPQVSSELCANYLKDAIGQALRLSPHRIHVDKPLEKYGVDSVVAVEIVGRIEEDFGRLPKSLLFQHRSVDALQGYLLREHAATCARLFGEGKSVSAAHKHSVPPGAPTLDAPIRAAQEEEVAIIGLAGVFPKAKDIEEFWSNLANGRDCLTEVPSERWEHNRYFDPRRGVEGKTYAKWGGFIENLYHFDNAFFGLANAEAAVTDPRELAFLECAWNALEAAGYTRDRLRQELGGKVGVFVGAGGREKAFSESNGGIANRCSSFLGIVGSSMTVDTMCSSSAVAFHLACTELRSGGCRMAIVGGVSFLYPEKYVMLSRAGLLASREDTRVFSGADGYIPAETVGAILLKPLSVAQRDGDDILAVVKATGVSHSGMSGSHTVPGPDEKAALMAGLFEQSGLSPQAVSFVECAASGFDIADEIELAALRRVLGPEGCSHCVLGSVKSNIGHAEAASFIAQLAKVVMQFRHRKLAPTIVPSSGELSAVFAGEAPAVQRKLEDWEPDVRQGGGSRLALINSFGAGGAFASVLLEEHARPSRRPDAAPSLQLAVLSAPSKSQLVRLAGAMRDQIGGTNEPLEDIVYTLQAGREAFAVRFAALVRTRAELVAAFNTYWEANGNPHQAAASVPMFHGDLTQVAWSDEAPVDESAVRALSTARDLHSIAMLWTNGKRVAWDLLHDVKPHRTALPTCRFAKRPWNGSSDNKMDDQVLEPPPVMAAAPVSLSNGIEDFIQGFLADYLNLERAAIALDRDIHEFGGSSIFQLRLRRALECAFDVTITGQEFAQMRSCRRLASLVAEKRPITSLPPNTSPVGAKMSSTTCVEKALHNFRAGAIDRQALELILADNGLA